MAAVTTKLGVRQSATLINRIVFGFHFAYLNIWNFKTIKCKLGKIIFVFVNRAYTAVSKCVQKKDWRKIAKILTNIFLCWWVESQATYF